MNHVKKVMIGYEMFVEEVKEMDRFSVKSVLNIVERVYSKGRYVYCCSGREDILFIINQVNE